MTDRELIARYPDIPWARAMPVQTPDAHGLACRFCMARNGLRAEDVRDLFQTADDWREHMRAEHADVLTGGIG